MPPSRPAPRALPPKPAVDAARLAAFEPEERDLLCILWVDDRLSLQLAGHRGLYESDVAWRWSAIRRGLAANAPIAPAPAADRERAGRLLRLLLDARLVISDGTGGAQRWRPAPLAAAALQEAVHGWWAEAGVLLPAGAARPVESWRPAEVATSFARLLGAADGIRLQVSARPGKRDQQELLRCLPASAMDGSWTAPEGEKAAGGTPAASGTAAAGGTPPPSVWSGFLPRLGPFLGAAAYEGLLSRGDGAWVVDGIEAWLETPTEEQWLRLAASWRRAAAAAALGPAALSIPGGWWLSPERLAAWAARYDRRAAGLTAFLTVAVAAGAVSFGLASLGRPGDGPPAGGPDKAPDVPSAAGTGAPSDELFFQLNELGRAAAAGRPPILPAPVPPEPGRVVAQSDFTLIEPLDNDPWTAYDLRRMAAVVSVDRTAVYRLEPAAWAAARERGLDAEEGIAFLEAATGNRVPQNVLFTLRHDWSGERQAAAVQPAVLLRFPSEEAAGRARGSPTVRGAVLEALTPTVWRLAPGREAAVRKALQALGIACGDLEANAAGEPSGGGESGGEAGGAAGGAGRGAGGAAAGKAGGAAAGGTAAKRGGTGKGATKDRGTGKAPAIRPVAAAAETGPGDPFRLPWPGPFGEPPSAPAAGGPPANPLAAAASAHGWGAAAPVPAAVVRMPPQALKRRLGVACSNRRHVWIETAEEGIVRFLPTEVTRGGVVCGECEGCGDTHVLALEEIRGMLDEDPLW